MNRNPESKPAQNFSCKAFTLWVVVLCLVLAGPAFRLSGTEGLEGLTLAAFLSLLPGWLVFLTFSRYGDPSKVALLFLVGSGFRLAFVLAGFLIVELTGRYSSPASFAVWLVILFLFTLAFETRQLLVFINSAPGSAENTKVTTG